MFPYKSFSYLSISVINPSSSSTLLIIRPIPLLSFIAFSFLSCRSVGVPLSVFNSRPKNKPLYKHKISGIPFRLLCA